MIRSAVVGLAVAGAGLLLSAGPALAATGDTGAPTPPGLPAPTGGLSPANDLTPAGVPVLGLVNAAAGATKALPGQSGVGH